MVSVRVLNPHSRQKAGLLFGESAPISHRPGEEERGRGAGAISMLPDHAMGLRTWPWGSDPDHCLHGQGAHGPVHHSGGSLGFGCFYVFSWHSICLLEAFHHGVLVLFSETSQHSAAPHLMWWLSLQMEHHFPPAILLFWTRELTFLQPCLRWYFANVIRILFSPGV